MPTRTACWFPRRRWNCPRDEGAGNCGVNVIPAKAGIQRARQVYVARALDPRIRGDDDLRAESLFEVRARNPIPPMIAWTPKFPKAALPLAYWRLLRARHQYFDRVGLRLGPWGLPRFTHLAGSQQRIAAMRDKCRGKRCFIIANGPSLQQLDMKKLRKEVTLGCNGIYRAFPEWGFHTTYLLFEDIEQLELRRHDVGRVHGPVKMAALYNAYAFKPDGKTIFFNAPRMRGQLYYWRDLYPQFSTDFASIVHLGSTVTYIMLQLAYHLGCDPVYIVGLDHDYGELPRLFPPGKITITEENIELIRGLHFSHQYYKVGDQIGVPDVAMQEAAYAKAREAFEADGRRVLNASAHTALEVFDRCEYDGLFGDK